MKFTAALAMQPPDELLPLARAAEEAGWDAIAMPDSVFFPDEVSGAYPYTPDGSRFWDADTPFVDPFVAIPAMAATTTHIRFYTNVLKVVLRHPLLVAKTVGSAAAMAEGRIAVGLGLSWMPEEFDWLDLDMATRGSRLDETIEILRRTLQPGYAEFRGRYHHFGRLVMSPAPKMAVPIYVGGHSEPALRRAARLADGWISAQISARDVPAVVSSLRDQLAAAGREDVPFEIKVTPLIPATPEAFAAVGEGGATDVITMPWMYYGGTSLDAKIDGLHRFADEIIRVIKS